MLKNNEYVLKYVLQCEMTSYTDYPKEYDAEYVVECQLGHDTDYPNMLSNVNLDMILNILYNMMGVFGTILIMHGISNLNGFLQEKQTDPLLGFGTFLFLVGQFLIIIAWSIDPAITIGRETADIGDMAIRQMSMFMLVTPVAFLGGTIISIVLSNRKFASPIYMKISALIFVIVIVLALYTLFKLADTSTHNSGSTIIPLFACFSIAQLAWFIWNIMVGSKMIKGNH